MTVVNFTPYYYCSHEHLELIQKSGEWTPLVGMIDKGDRDDDKQLS